jgi:hypothetical protein
MVFDDNICAFCVAVDGEVEWHHALEVAAKLASTRWPIEVHSCFGFCTDLYMCCFFGKVVGSIGAIRSATIGGCSCVGCTACSGLYWLSLHGSG